MVLDEQLVEQRIRRFIEQKTRKYPDIFDRRGINKKIFNTK